MRVFNESQKLCLFLLLLLRVQESVATHCRQDTVCLLVCFVVIPCTH